MKNVVLLGAPGCGKGTQTRFIKDLLNFSVISVGDILRNEISLGTNIGVIAKKYIDDGKLVPSGLIINMINDVLMQSRVEDIPGFIFDGFPRNLEQALALDVILKNLSINLDYVFEVKVDEETLIKRISGRFSCAKCGAVYNKYFSEQNCGDECYQCKSREFLIRSDDNLETLKKRIFTYNEETKPLIEFYAKKSLHYLIDGLKTPNAIKEEIFSLLKS